MKSTSWGLLVSSLVAFAAIATSCGSSGRAGRSPLPVALAERYPIDGQFDLSTFSGVQSEILEFVDGLGSGSATGKTTTVRWVLVNDDADLYVAVEWNDATYDHTYSAGPVDFDGIKLLFDDDGDGVYEAGEDARIIYAASVSSSYIDQRASAGDETDRVGDGLGRLSYDSASHLYRAEFLLPLADDSTSEDGPFDASSRFNLVLYDHFEIPAITGGAAMLRPGTAIGVSTVNWINLPVVAAGAHDRGTVPTGLTGLVALISDHDEAVGEIYTFDPATGVVVRVTTLPALFKENVSLSPDRTRLAFHGATSKADFTTYEIYTVDVDGTNFSKLTNNSLLDGHPGWSPDSSKICYASFRNGSDASIIVMSSTGTEIADITPVGVDDNDPDYLADGRIVFKTDRFSTSPEKRIAVMNADGTGVVPLTSVNGVSDHDPIAVGTVTWFERFLKNTSYVTDPEALFTPWVLVEAQLDGSGERTVLADAFVNWLPVTGPSPGYVCFLKTVGYTDVRLMTTTGRQLGRFVPDLTRVRYIDWK